MKKVKYVFPVAEKAFIKFGCTFDPEFSFVYWRLPRLGRFVALSTYLCFLGGDLSERDYDFELSLRDYVGFDLIKRLDALDPSFNLLNIYTHMNQRKKIGFWLGFINRYQKDVL